MADKDKDRRFQPIYDALNQHNLAQVVRLCDKRDLQRHPLAKVHSLEKVPISADTNDTSLQAIKAVAMERSGHHKDAAILAAQVAVSCFFYWGVHKSAHPSAGEQADR